MSRRARVSTSPDPPERVCVPVTVSCGVSTPKVAAAEVVFVPPERSLDVAASALYIFAPPPALVSCSTGRPTVLAWIRSSYRPPLDVTIECVSPPSLSFLICEASVGVWSRSRTCSFRSPSPNASSAFAVASRPRPPSGCAPTGPNSIPDFSAGDGIALAGRLEALEDLLGSIRREVEVLLPVVQLAQRHHDQRLADRLDRLDRPVARRRRRVADAADPGHPVSHPRAHQRHPHRLGGHQARGALAASGVRALSRIARVADRDAAGEGVPLAASEPGAALALPDFQIVVHRGAGFAVALDVDREGLEHLRSSDRADVPVHARRDPHAAAGEQRQLSGEPAGAELRGHALLHIKNVRGPASQFMRGNVQRVGRTCAACRPF